MISEKARSSRMAAVRQLPTSVRSLSLRLCERNDLRVLSNWPTYAFPYEVFTFSFSGGTENELDLLFERWESDATRIALVIDYEQNHCVAYIGLLDINWQAMRIANISVRIHPNWCGQGVGTRSLQLLIQWAASAGIRSIHLDVAASNQAAIAVYDKAGFRVRREFWRPAPDLAEADLDSERFAFVRPHVRLSDPPQLRFLAMSWEHATGSDVTRMSV